MTTFLTRRTALLAAATCAATLGLTAIGHAQTSTTLNVYSHVLPGANTRAAAAMERLLKAPEPELPTQSVKLMAIAIATTFARWKTLDRARKLALLDRMGAQIHIGRYQIRGVSLAGSAYTVSQSKTANPAGITPPVYIPFRGAA